MNNLKSLIIVGFSFFGLINADVNVKAWKKDHPVNKLDGNGNNLGHRFALDCQKFDGPEITRKIVAEELRRMHLNDFDMRDANPFITNKDGKTPREISQDIFKKTGSLNCIRMALEFKDLEKRLLKEIAEECANK